jgi:hypothetical protein
MKPLDDVRVPVRHRLAALWAALMFCYVYGDFFGLFVPGRLKDMMAGNFGQMGPTTDGLLVGSSLLLAVPALMIYATLVVPARACQWANLLLGVFYAVVMALTMPGSPLFYQALGVVEIAIGLVTVVTAWRWPRAVSTNRHPI